MNGNAEAPNALLAVLVAGLEQSNRIALLRARIEFNSLALMWNAGCDNVDPADFTERMNGIGEELDKERAL